MQMNEKNLNTKSEKSKEDEWILKTEDGENKHDFSFFVKNCKNESKSFLKTSLNTYSKLTPKDSDMKQFSEKTHEKSKSYIIGDAGSSWRMMKLGKIYEIASQTGRSVHDVALERYGTLEAFYEALEEKEELDRRKIHGPSKKRVTGSLYKQYQQLNPQKFSESSESLSHSSTASDVITVSTLNKLQAEIMKAQMRGVTDVSKLQKKYQEMVSIFESQKTRKDIIIPNNIDIMRKKPSSVVDPDNITIEEMVKEEKMTKNYLYKRQYRQMAEQIVRDPHFKDDLDYYDENAEKLSKRIQRREIDFRNMEISDFQRIQKILDTCPLCHQDSSPPIAPVISMGTRIYLSLPSPPELAKYHALIVPIHHRVNTLECDDDEWDEIRNFMKCLIKMADERNHDVIFYENASTPHRRMHTAIEAVPVPRDVAIQAPAFFREAILSSDEEWSQHQKIIDTLARAKKGLGKMAFRHSITKEAPYFHVWFEIDGGIGHIVENLDKWGKGDLFTRQVFATMLDLDPTIYRRRGKWTGMSDPREKAFLSVWTKYDWTQSIKTDNS
ncbi:uncharacterized protein T551_03319 [Pneumocystis jirovecii RU7]|uniref:Cwf19-like C-terminal domain-containing protein n=1 Tax=Pneumocystis jirovecii (strain RU7) TaxID=1408657 RepID=A0A0W4ZEQ2_PNEJ7|nr:uncharacterized protein T551_03319 [Pneumocystis jirovecii RU7]KTW26857.1 hypothetical protein T551_03319 [Pneumocystis jirovecii RU7]